MLVLKYGLFGVLGLLVLFFLVGSVLYRIPAAPLQRFEMTAQKVILSPTYRMAFEMAMGNAAIFVDGQPDVFYFNSGDAKKIYDLCPDFGTKCRITFEAGHVFFGGIGPARLIAAKKI